MEEISRGLIQYGYLIVFITVLAEQVGIPLPAVPILLAAGALAGGGELSLVLILLLAVAASVLADLLWYWMGRWKGTSVLGGLCRFSLEPDSCVRRTEEVFSRHGAVTLLYAKWVPGISTVAPPLAGLFQMKPLRFLVYDFAGAVFWITPFILLGHLFTEQLERIARTAAQAGGVAGIILAASLALYLLFKYLKRRRFIRQLRIARILPEDLHEMIQSGEDLVIVDLRHSVDFEAEPTTLPGALRMSPEEIEDRHEELPRDREIILYCT